MKWRRQRSAVTEGGLRDTSSRFIVDTEVPRRTLSPAANFLSSTSLAVFYLPAAGGLSWPRKGNHFAEDDTPPSEVNRLK